MKDFLLYGEVVVWILCSFNILYLLDFIVFGVFLKVWNLCCKPSQNQLHIQKTGRFSEKSYVQREKNKVLEKKKINNKNQLINKGNDIRLLSQNFLILRNSQILKIK